MASPRGSSGGSSQVFTCLEVQIPLRVWSKGRTQCLRSCLLWQLGWEDQRDFLKSASLGAQGAFGGAVGVSEVVLSCSRAAGATLFKMGSNFLRDTVVLV